MEWMAGSGGAVARSLRGFGEGNRRKRKSKPLREILGPQGRGGGETPSGFLSTLPPTGLVSSSQRR